MDAFDREEQHLEDEYAAGNLTIKEFNKEIRELRRDYRGCTEESASMAYEEEMSRW